MYKRQLSQLQNANQLLTVNGANSVINTDNQQFFPLNPNFSQSITNKRQHQMLMFNTSNATQNHQNNLQQISQQSQIQQQLPPQNPLQNQGSMLLIQSSNIVATNNFNQQMQNYQSNLINGLQGQSMSFNINSTQIGNVQQQISNNQNTSNVNTDQQYCESPRFKSYGGQSSSNTGASQQLGFQSFTSVYQLHQNQQPHHYYDKQGSNVNTSISKNQSAGSSKLVSLLQSHSILPQSRESNSQTAGGQSHSSKKHRELRRAQEISNNISQNQPHNQNRQSIQQVHGTSNRNLSVNVKSMNNQFNGLESNILSGSNQALLGSTADLSGMLQPQNLNTLNNQDGFNLSQIQTSNLMSQVIASNTQITPVSTHTKAVYLNKSAVQARSQSREQYQEEIVNFESQNTNVTNATNVSTISYSKDTSQFLNQTQTPIQTNQSLNLNAPIIPLRAIKSGSASSAFRRGSERQQKGKDFVTSSQTRQTNVQSNNSIINIDKIEPQPLTHNSKGSSTPVAKNLINLNMMSSQYDNSSNRDIESELSGNESEAPKDFNDFFNKVNDKNDNLSEVSEESAFEEEDDEYFGGNENANFNNNSLSKANRDGVQGLNNDKNPTRFSNDVANGEEEGKQALEGTSKKKKPSIRILASMPKNAKEEEEKFFQSGFTVNPQFEYDNPQVASKFINQFKKPRSDLLPFSQKIMDAFLQHYGSESNYFLTEGRVITDQDETEQIFKKYLEEHNILDIAIINFSDKIVAPTSVTYDNYSSKIKINIQVPVEYREGRILGVLHHEIGTHFLRRLNETKQVWHGKRKKYGLKSCITIEEGMGCIHMMLEQSKDKDKKPYLFKPALNYYACYKASELSFVELFNDLEKYVDNPKKRWKYVLRVKRGLSDTSQPGGLYKDQVYLEGAIKVLKNRKDINFKLLYSGKLNIEDLKRPKFIKKAQLDGVIIPKFMEDLKEYRKSLDVIAKFNFID